MSCNMEDARTDLLSDDPEIQGRGKRIVESLAAQGDALAMYARATWYLHGSNGYELDLIKARELLEQSSQLLVPEAMYDLAVLIEKNDKSRNRKRRAFALYAIAAAMGDRDSLVEMERCFYWGIGIYKDRDMASIIAKKLASTQDN